MMEALLKRDRLILVIGLGVVLATAWGWLLSGVGMDMSPVEMTAMAEMDGWLMQPAAWTPAYALLMFGMWWVMMLAMMLPSAAPMLLLFARIYRKEKPAREPVAPTMAFALGYLLIWGGFSAVATSVQWGLESARLLSPMLTITNHWLGATLLVAAGAWQLSPVKSVCLRHCRSPLSFLIGNWRPGRFGSFCMGLQHGTFCLGCCWFLMVLLFFGGVMNLYWIGGLAVFVLLEKFIPMGHWLGRVLGLALVFWGSVLAIQ